MFIIVLSSSPIDNVHRPSSVAFLFFIGCLLNDMYVFEIFYSSFGSQLSRNVDERGRNLMCVRTLPSLPVQLKKAFVKK